MKNRKSIRQKLIRLLLIMGITPSVLTMVIMYFGITSNLETQTGNNLQSLATETSLRVNMFIENKIENVLKYSSYSTLKRIYFPGSNNDSTSEFIRSLFKFDPDLYNISLIDDKKNLLFSYRPNLFFMQDLNVYWNKLDNLNNSQTLINYQLQKGQNLKNLLEIITPLSSDLNQKKLGIMIVSIDIANLVKMIENIPISGKYYISLISSKGKIIASTRKNNKIETLPQNMLNIFKFEKGWNINFDILTNTSSVFGYSTVQNFLKNSLSSNQLYVYISKEKSEAFQPIIDLIIKLIAFSLGVIAIILIILVTRIETIWKPIISLKKGAEMIGRGNFDMTLFIPTNDELEDLANTFNVMGKNLKQSRSTLEDQNKKLIELNSVKNNFLSMVSHELRTPLMIIKEAISQIVEGFKGPVSEDQSEFLNMALRNTNRLNQIINDLLTISKIENGKMKFTRKKHNLISIIKNEIINQQIKINERKINLIQQFDSDSIEVYCDEEKVQMVFTNLLGNAIKFIQSEGSIKIIAKKCYDYIQVSVQDNGPGIPNDSLEKIFERFVRLNPKPLSGAPSTGLGLSIARELIEMHGGKIWAENNKTGGGAQFNFTLPIYRDFDYLNIYLNDRITEANDRKLNLSVFKIQLFNKMPSLINNERFKFIFSEINKNSYNNLFEPLEIISIETKYDIYIFSFLDSKSSNIISQKILDLITEYIFHNNINDLISLSVKSATLNENGNNSKEILNYLDKNS